MNKYFITGDCHGQFDKIVDFVKENNFENLTIFICGDVGLNYNFNKYDEDRKKILRSLNATFICIRGNHDANHSKMKSYKEINKFNGIMYFQEDYPNIFFTKDGEVYEINGKKILCCGGAYSVDKQYRIDSGLMWFNDEQMSQQDKEYAVRNLDKINYKVDYVITHTCPLFAVPKFRFMKNVDQSTVDNSMEIWLEWLCDAGLTWKEWYCGHWHIDMKYNWINFLYNSFVEMDI